GRPIVETPDAEGERSLAQSIVGRRANDLSVDQEGELRSDGAYRDPVPGATALNGRRRGPGDQRVAAGPHVALDEKGAVVRIDDERVVVATLLATEIQEQICIVRGRYQARVKLGEEVTEALGARHQRRARATGHLRDEVLAAVVADAPRRGVARLL